MGGSGGGCLPRFSGSFRKLHMLACVASSLVTSRYARDAENSHRGALKPLGSARRAIAPRTGFFASVGLRGTSCLWAYHACVDAQVLRSRETRRRDPFNATAAYESHSQAAAGPPCARPVAQHRLRRAAQCGAKRASGGGHHRRRWVCGSSYFFASSLGKLSHHRCDGIGRMGARGRCCWAQARGACSAQRVGRKA